MLSINSSFGGVSAYLGASQRMMDTAAARLSSGRRINSAKDDAAGLAIATRMDSQIRGMNVALRNAQDAASMTAVADSGLESAVKTAQRMREIAVQASSSTADGDRSVLQDEYQKLGAELTRALGGINFNGKALFGADAGQKDFQIGADGGTGSTISVTSTNLAGDTDITALATAAITTAAEARTQISDMDDVLDKLSTERTKFGAAQNRVDLTMENISSQLEATKAAQGRILDVDFAAETANFSKGQLLQQAALQMMAQANASKSSLLNLLRF